MKRTRNVYHYHIRKAKRSMDMVSKNKMLNACLNGNGNLFDQIKKMRKCPPTYPNSIDGIKDNIPDHFASVYKKLYNSGKDEVALNKIDEIVEKSIKTDLDEVRKVTSNLLKDASKKLKPNKSDPLIDITTDCLINAPSILFDNLAIVLQSYLIHGHVTRILLLSTLIPIIKDKIGDASVSENYRSIAISSFILKLFDWVIIILCNDSL